MVVSFYAALFSLMLVSLSLHVIRGRRLMRVPLGDGNDQEMQRRMRAHGNFVEYTPYFLLLLFLAEYQGLNKGAVHCLGSLFFAARCVHAYGILIGEHYQDGKLMYGLRYRKHSIITIFSCFIVLALILFVQFFKSL